MILVVSLSPAWQRTLEFDCLQPGKVNRATRIRETASGKGVNVARVAGQLGADVRVLTVAGGHRGRQLVGSIRAQRLPVRIVRVRAETRICQTLIVAGVATELVEETGRLTKRELAEFVARFEWELGRARLLVLTGSVPPGCGGKFYARLIARAKRVGVAALVDAQGAQILNATEAHPLLIKINADELAVAPDLRRRQPEWLVVTDGAQRVVIWHGHERQKIRPPRVKAVNTIGSGDAMLAGIAAALWRGKKVPDAVLWGVACGAANAMTSMPGCIRLSDVRALRANTFLDNQVASR